jgi:sarcosine dehydrogenase
MLTSGTTWHAAGLMGTARMGKSSNLMAKYSIDMYKSFKDEINAEKSSVGWHSTGSLAVARNDDLYMMCKQWK